MIFNLLKITPKNSLNFDCVYSHLKNYLKIQQSIRGCLEQARIGETKGSYCERLMGQAVCDVATNVLFKTAGQFSDRTGTDGKNPHDDSSLFNILGGVQNGDKILNDRYKGTFYDKAGLGTEQIVNKVCLGAITGDWSVLTDNILSSIDENEVEPVFGPLLAESRLQGYDPYNGAMSIRYTFTYAAVSGGQRIDSNVEFICDSSQPGGEYCPDGRYSSTDLSSSFNMPKLYVSDGGSKQDTVVITDTTARYRYNIVKVTHKYQVKKEAKEKIIEENIFAKGEALLANCYFTGGVMGSGGGFNCDTLFDNDALASAYTIDKTRTNLIPSEKKTYYPGDDLYLRLQYRTNVDQFNAQNEFDLAYKAECPSANSGAKALKLGYKTIGTGNNAFGLEVVSLFQIPVVGATIEDDYTIYSGTPTTIIPKGKTRKIKFTNLLTENAIQFEWSNSVPKVNYAFVNCQSGAQILAAKETIICEIKTTSDITSSSQFNLNIKGDVRNKIGIEIYDGDKKEFTLSPANVVGTTLTSFDTIGPGSCDITIKLLASGQGADAIGSLDAFNNANVLGEDIIASKNINTENEYKLSFKVAKTLDKKDERDKETYIEFYDPVVDGTKCIDDNDGGKFFVSYVGSTQSDEILYIQFDWYLLNYGKSAKKEGFETFYQFGGNDYLEIELSSEALYTLKKSGNPEPFVLKYLISDDSVVGEGKIYNKETTQTFNILVKDKSGCSSTSAYDTKYPVGDNNVEPSGTDSSANGETSSRQ